jgi:hypothetical protein
VENKGLMSGIFEATTSKRDHRCHVIAAILIGRIVSYRSRAFVVSHHPHDFSLATKDAGNVRSRMAPTLIHAGSLRTCISKAKLMEFPIKSGKQ